MADAMLDTTFTALAKVADEQRWHSLALRALELAYDELGHQ